MDSGNRLVLCNSKYQRLRDLTGEAHPRGQRISLAAWASAPDVLEAWPGGTARRRRLRSRTYEARLADGRWLQVNERRTRDGGYVSVGDDITALKEHEQQLVNSERLLLATVAQLTTPADRSRIRPSNSPISLDRITAESAGQGRQSRQGGVPRQHEPRTAHAAGRHHRLLAVDGEPDFGPLGSKGPRLSGHILASGEYLLQVVSDILDMSQLEAGHERLCYARFGAEQAVGAVQDVATMARGKCITIAVDVVADLTIEADPAAVERFSVR